MVIVKFYDIRILISQGGEISRAKGTVSTQNQMTKCTFTFHIAFYSEFMPYFQELPSYMIITIMHSVFFSSGICGHNAVQNTEENTNSYPQTIQDIPHKILLHEKNQVHTKQLS
jgi:hypothetical protein